MHISLHFQYAGQTTKIDDNEDDNNNSAPTTASTNRQIIKWRGKKHTRKNTKSWNANIWSFVVAVNYKSRAKFKIIIIQHENPFLKLFQCKNEQTFFYFRSRRCRRHSILLLAKNISHRKRDWEVSQQEAATAAATEKEERRTPIYLLWLYCAAIQMECWSSTTFYNANYGTSEN